MLATYKVFRFCNCFAHAADIQVNVLVCVDVHLLLNSKDGTRLRRSMAILVDLYSNNYSVPNNS